MSDDQSSNPPTSRSWIGRITQAFSDEPRSREEVLELLRNAEKEKLIDSEACRIFEGALEVSDQQAREIMIPRPQMVVINADESPREFLPEMISSAHSRFPVIGSSPDEVIGILLAKDLLPYFLNGGIDQFNIRDHLRPANFVPESKRLNVLLKEFRDNRNHMAIVVDEYGCIAGLITIEDVLEQIVGEIEDEYDDDEDDTQIKQIEDNCYLVKALTPIDEFNEHFGSHFSDDAFDTIGGIITQGFGRMPARDECVTIEGFEFRVLNADNRRVRLVQVSVIDKD